MFAIYSLLLWSFSHSLGLLFSYLAHNNFPQPLTAQEEQVYLQKMLAGDIQARQILIERNLRMVAHLAKKFEKSGEENEDLISIGTIGLIKAVNSYNPQKASRLATYASKCIENEILMHFRSRKKLQLEFSLHEPLGIDPEGNEITFADLLGTETELVMEKALKNLNKEKLKEVFPNLPEQEKQVLLMRYGLEKGEEFTQKQVAGKLGISRSYVSRIEKRALQHLNQFWQE